MLEMCALQEHLRWQNFHLAFEDEGRDGFA